MIMEQPKQLSELVRELDTLPIPSYAATQSKCLELSRQRGTLVMQRFGSEDDFMMKVNPSTQTAFGENPKTAITGDYPTLRDIDMAYGNGFSTEWVMVQIDNMSLHTGARNLTKEQQLELSRIIATEYRHLKVTELLLFFYRFKTGRYGRFYGSVDPMVVTCALRDFVEERNSMIDQYDQERRTKESEKGREGAITYEEWIRMKQNNNAL